MPLPPALGLWVARAIATSMASFGIFFKEEMSPAKYVEVAAGKSVECPGLRFSYTLSAQEQAWKRAAETRFRTALVKGGCIPLGMVDPGPAGSIHYAGTIPRRNMVNPELCTLEDGTIAGLPNVYAGDSASWDGLPAKSLSFTLAANGIRVAELAAGK